MSMWASLEASFTFEKPADERVLDTVAVHMPTGSESGPSARIYEGEVYVTGRMRDTDDTDSPEVLAWFVGLCANWPYATKATLTFDVDSGPRYRYEWADGKLTKLKGILDL